MVIPASLTMTAHLPDQIAWAARVGSRLRMLQASFADDDAAARVGYIEEELEREMREIPPSSRAAFLNALAERFPAGDADAESPAVSVPVAAPTQRPVSAPAAAATPTSPEALVAQLARMSASLSVEARRELAARLRQAGFEVVRAVAGNSEETDEVPAELQKKLSIDADAKLDRKRVLRLVAVLVDLVVTMDQLTWNMWKNLAPNSIVRRDPGVTGDLRKLAGPYLVGDNEVSSAQITQLVEKTRQLIAGLLAAIGATGEGFARQHLCRFSPQSIQDQANADPGFFIGAEQKCWRKYIQLFNETTGPAIEQIVVGIIVKYTEDLILGAGRPPAEN